MRAKTHEKSYKRKLETMQKVSAESQTGKNRKERKEQAEKAEKKKKRMSRKQGDNATGVEEKVQK